MSHLMKAATDVACTIIQAKAARGAVSFDTDAISREAVDIVMRIKNELINQHGGVCDPDALTPVKMDEIIGRHVQNIHSLLHRNT